MGSALGVGRDEVRGRMDNRRRRGYILDSVLYNTAVKEGISGRKQDMWALYLRISHWIGIFRTKLFMRGIQYIHTTCRSSLVCWRDMCLAISLQVRRLMNMPITVRCMRPIYHGAGPRLFQRY